MLGSTWRSVLAFLFMAVPFSASAGRCVVVSGLPEDQKGAFSDFKKEGVLNGCDVFRSFEELAASNPSGETLDIRLLAHGQSGNRPGEVIGATECRIAESPAKIVKTLNALSENNNVLGTFSSCFSDQIMKERILFDQTTPAAKNFMVDKSCLYVASTSRNSANTDEPSLYRTQFLSPQSIKGKSVLDLFSSTATGMLSAAPFDAAGVTDAWKEGANEVNAKKFSNILSGLNSSNMPTHKCLAKESCLKTSAGSFLEISKAIESMRLEKKRTTWKFEDRELSVESYVRLCKNESSGQLFRKMAKNPYGEIKPSDFAAACGAPWYKEHKNYNPEKLYEKEIACRIRGTSESDLRYISALWNAREVMDKLKIPQKRESFFPDHTDPDELEKEFLAHFTEKKPTEFNACSMDALLGVSKDPQIGPSGIDGSSATDWGSILGTFSHLSVAQLANGSPVSQSKLDRRRFEACKNFQYDPAGSLQFKSP